MERIVDLHAAFMERLITEGSILQELERHGIKILPGFLEQIELVRSYYKKFYTAPTRRIVFCGINPKHYGGRKTGIPFVDFIGVERLMPGCSNERRDQERSAQFMLSIMEAYEPGTFQDTVYLTNLSWYGFLRNGRTLNFYNLPASVRHHFIDSFTEEMKIVQPVCIVPLSQEIARTLRLLQDGGHLDYPIADRLPHPMQCSFPSNRKRSRERYFDVYGTLEM
ncbi:hypothetical protein NCCP2716_17190 [Sporosarcina sp. NCCP-2716]|uniref:uracil-DNA glycosylase family protein n=1 Tax=Sporosarcina sp. NCCP-2716 TaxID=2943679 RepID=UPI00203C148A|nr:uracil-DNA glycosylase family protein [Sporosarcina sp. NCCP-2716]GKV69221.1 hypothetical protein NCCP2716_17190 [Sporosarcina sp. NCCP-2716]